MLTERQLQAVNSKAKRIAVLASAGTGKTTTLVERVKRIRRDEPKSRILAFTFTRAAASEMAKRIGEDHLTKVCTIHSHMLWILGLYTNKKHEIASDAQIKFIVRKLLKERGIDPNRELDGTIAKIGLYKNTLKDPGREIMELIEAFDREMQAIGCVTFDDIQLIPVLEGMIIDAFRDNDHILVDEYQDVCPVQEMAIQKLLGPETSLFVVGDWKQSIYRFRGSESSILKNFADNYPGCETIFLDKTFRTPVSVIGTVNTFANRMGESENVNTNSIVVGSVSVVECRDQWHEAEVVGAYLLGLSGKELGETRIMFRLNIQSAPIEEFCIKNDIPYVLIGATQFWKRQHVVAMLQYLWLSIDGNAGKNVNNNPELLRAWKTVLSFPNRYITSKAMSQFNYLSRNNGGVKALESMYVNWSSNVLDTIRKLVNIEDPKIAIATILAETNYLSWLSRSFDKDDSGEDDLNQLLDIAEKFSSKESLISHVAEQIIKQTQVKYGEAVVLSTIHTSKGLEANRAILIGACDGIMPHERGDLEEETNLWYVAITRTKRDLIVTYPKFFRRGAVDRSPFLSMMGK